MGGLIMLVLLVVVVAGVASAVTLLLSSAIRRQAGPGPQRPPLPPRQPPPVPRPQQSPRPDYPAYNPTNFLSPGDRERILILIRGGRKIQAIKLYREVTGAGLREAKDAVDYLERYR